MFIILNKMLVGGYTKWNKALLKLCHQLWHSDFMGAWMVK